MGGGQLLLQHDWYLLTGLTNYKRQTLFAEKKSWISKTKKIRYGFECDIINKHTDLRPENMKNSALGEESSNMVHKLEAIHGGGGSIKLGTKGTISSLMTKELDSIKTPKQTPPRHKSQAIPAWVACSSTTLKRLQPRKSLDGAGTSRGRNSTSYKSPQSTKNVHQMPMLGSENVALERTPIRQKSDKKVVSNIVEVVDIKCGNSDRAWSTPITNRLKKLGFSKLSETIV